MVNADTAIELEDVSQLMEESEVPLENNAAVDDVSNQATRRGGAEANLGGNDGADEARSGENGGANGPTSGGMIDDSTRYHYPVLEDGSRSNSIGAPWFLPGKAVEPSEGRPQRVRKVPDRLTYACFAVSEPLLREPCD
jgi:hypothetical protein